MVEIVPAILTNDKADFRLKYSNLLPLGQHFTKLHIDFIDGEFLPNKTLLPADLDFLNPQFTLIAHLMTLNPDKYFLKLKEIGFEWVIVHCEAFESNEEILKVINEGNDLELKMGIALNPETSLHSIAKMIPKVSLVQVMGVHPGAQGQGFGPNTLSKIEELKSLGGNVIIAVDGGVKLGIAANCVKAGASMIVLGSAILNATHPKEALEAFKRELELL